MRWREETRPPGVRTVTVTSRTVRERSGVAVDDVTEAPPGDVMVQPSDTRLYSYEVVSSAPPETRDTSARFQTEGPSGLETRQTVWGSPEAA